MIQFIWFILDTKIDVGLAQLPVSLDIPKEKPHAKRQFIFKEHPVRDPEMVQSNNSQMSSFIQNIPPIEKQKGTK